MDQKSPKKRKTLIVVIVIAILAVAGFIIGGVVASNTGESWDADRTGGEGNHNSSLDLE